jgi:hypothetical protein
MPTEIGTTICCRSISARPAKVTEVKRASLSHETDSMTTFEVAHIREQGQDMIIVPMRSDFGLKTTADQSKIEYALRAAAHGAGLAGQVVTVWDGGGGRMVFRSPPQWKSFFTSLTLAAVAASINKRITVN